MLNAFVGVAVKTLQKQISFLETKKSRGALLVGVPFEGDLTRTEQLKRFLITNGYVKQEDIVGNYMFIGNVSKIESSDRA